MSEARDSESIRSQSDKQGSSRADRERQEKIAREQMLRVIFTTEARERLSNIRMVRPDLAESIENQLFEYATTGKLRKQVTDEELKAMLGSFQRPKRDFKINYK
jgi:programmed cell death protein 5